MMEAWTAAIPDRQRYKICLSGKALPWEAMCCGEEKIPLAGGRGGGSRSRGGQRPCLEPGGGMVLVPALHKFTDVEEDSLFPTSVAVIFPLCLVSLTVYGLHGDLPWQTAWPYLVGSALGGVAAGVFGRKVSTNLLHRILGILILWGGIRSFL